MDEICNWVFDLDDTLYAERDYVQSALAYVGAEVKRLYGIGGFTSLLLSLSAQRHPDPIAQAWSQWALPDTELSAMILAMRAHVPLISLSEGAKTVLGHLRQRSRSYAIITDGRSTTQRAKIAALACTDAVLVSISEEVGLSKLDPARFAAVADAFPVGQFCYIGDNPAKDFYAPRQLGWKTIMLNHRGQGVHAQQFPSDPSYHPDHIVSDLAEILPLL